MCQLFGGCCELTRQRNHHMVFHGGKLAALLFLARGGVDEGVK